MNVIVLNCPHSTADWWYGRWVATYAASNRNLWPQSSKFFLKKVSYIFSLKKLALKKFLIFSQKKFFLYFAKLNILVFLIFREMERSSFKYKKTFHISRRTQIFQELAKPSLKSKNLLWRNFLCLVTFL